MAWRPICAISSLACAAPPGRRAARSPGTPARRRPGQPHRRSYIRLLLAGEITAAPAPRTARRRRSTRAEAGAAFPAATGPIAGLTAAYERARYHPDAATSADADAAERAWGEIEVKALQSRMNNRWRSAPYPTQAIIVIQLSIATRSSLSAKDDPGQCQPQAVSPGG